RGRRRHRAADGRGHRAPPPGGTQPPAGANLRGYAAQTAAGAATAAAGSVRRLPRLPGEERMSPFAVLGIEETADDAQVRAAYLAKVRRSPPDRDPDGFRRVREAYEAVR